MTNLEKASRSGWMSDERTGNQISADLARGSAMTAFVVADIVKGGLDATGAVILEVYSKVAGRYAVYRTDEQVMIHFADDDAEGVNQRVALRHLASVRAKVNGALQGLRRAKAARFQDQLTEHERAIAFALTVALQGDPQLGEAQLLAIAAEMADDRASAVRTRHLLSAAAATLGAVLLSRLLAGVWFERSFGPFAAGVSPAYWNAGAIGAIGALFSISLQIRSRQMPVDLQPWDNVTDAILRILVGATSAVLLIALLSTTIVDLQLAGRPLVATAHGFFVAAFAAGFTERLVADFLSGFSLTRRQPPAAVSPLQAPTKGNELTIAGSGSAAKAAALDIGAVDRDFEAAAEPDEDELEAASEPHPAGFGERKLVALGPVG